MTDADRKELFLALLGDITPLCGEETACAVLELSALGQLEAIEPVIDRMLARTRAERRAA